MKKLWDKTIKIFLWGLLYFICLIGSMVATFKIMFKIGADEFSEE